MLLTAFATRCSCQVPSAHEKASEAQGRQRVERASTRRNVFRCQAAPCATRGSHFVLVTVLEDLKNMSGCQGIHHTALHNACGPGLVLRYLACAP